MPKSRLKKTEIGRPTVFRCGDAKRQCAAVRSPSPLGGELELDGGAFSRNVIYYAAMSLKQHESRAVNKDKLDLVRKYLAEVAVQWKTGQATEHSYRPALKTLLEGLLRNVIVINEPQRIKCGAPDYILRDRRTALHLGFIEAKDIGDGDLDGNGVHREQFNRYRNSLETLCFTDYLDFHFYEGGEFRGKIRIAEICGSRLVPAQEPVVETFVEMIERFGSAKVQKVTSPTRLAKLMAGKARLLAQAIREFLAQDTERESMLASQMVAFRDVLIHDITEESFADVYAQTITYGMFAARLHDDTPENFTRSEAATLIPKTNPLLRQMFTYIASDTNDTVEWIVDDLVTLFAATDLREMMKDYGKSTGQTDPILHFYEDFLAAYNPALRKARGVWYTPQPVVGFIVRSVDGILETEFGLPGGLANSSKAKFRIANDNRNRKSDKAFVEREMHRVQILDPATGTGTFLAETVRQIHARFAGMQGMWQSYVSEHLLPRLNGFEILMASYAMAHLKIDLLLAETGYRHESNERLRVFLANSLEEYDRETGTLFAAALSKEANEANYIKRDCPVMVVIGNPPYSGESQNKGKAIMHLMEDYKKEPGGVEKLKERNPKWINDDYVKFIRMAQHYIDRTGEGVLGYICPHGFLDNPTFRGMRWHLLKSFDKIYTINLHGNSLKKEVCPDGSKDENVFDIMQGVSVNLFVKTGKKATGELGKVFHADLWGTRETKYKRLNENSCATTDYTEVTPTAPMYFFVPKDLRGETEYQAGFSVCELMSEFSMGITTGNDGTLVKDSAMELCNSVESEYLISAVPAKIRPLSYRPFDKKVLYYDASLLARAREKFMSHLDDESISLALIRICSKEDNCPVVVAQGLVDKTILSSKDNAAIFPLYLYSDNMGKMERTANLDKGIWAKINAAAGFDTTPEDVFNYIYAVLHTPEYRERYREFLKVDFPRIPYPDGGDAFRALADIGRQLVAVHLMKDAATGNMFDPRAQFPAAGTNRVDFVKYADGRVAINSGQHFDNVPETAWNFFIGGYQPAQKWLKDRKGRTLTSDDIMHYKAIIIALMETSRLMAELSALANPHSDRSA